MAPDVAVLRIRLLGELSLQSTAGELPLLESGRAISLLACLLVHREAPQSRQRLAFLLWPDSTEPQALTNLRHLLHTLRRALPDSDRFLHVTQRAVGWRADAPYWLDVAAFEDALRREALEEAVELYRGDLLEGLDEPWLRAERARLQRLYLGALERLAPILEARGDHAEAILCAERLLRHDPLQEEAYRLLMRMHDARGDRARAVRVYHVCAAVLEHELGVEPSQPTRDAYEALLQAAPEPVSAGGQPFVGRTREHERAAATWRRSAAGRAQLLLVTGEAGVGKTRLVEELRSACARGGAATAEARSYAAEGALAYGPVVAWLRSPAFAGASERVEGGRSELARLLPELGDPPAAPERHSEHERRVRLFDTVARVLLSPGAPVLLVADDLQWWDPDSLQLLHYVLRAEPDARLLVAATARAEDVAANPALHDVAASLRAAGRCEELALERMSRADTAQLAERVAERPLSELEQDALYGETEGNPLFVVEAVRAGWPQAAGGEPWPTPRVQTVIESRLAQLSEPARDLVGVAATIGREFTTDVLAAASGADSTTLVPALDELWRRRVIQERVPDGYDFTHDKLREVALAALSPAARRSHHLRVARALERLQPAGTVAGQLAAHLDAAGAVDEAISRYLVAADAAHERYAHADAVSLLGRAIELGRRLPPTPQHRERDLAILTALPDPLGAVEGYASPRLRDVQRQALELAAALGVEPAPPLLRSLAIASLSRGEFEEAERFGHRLRAHAEREGDGVLLAESAYVLGIAAFWQAEFEAAREQFEAAVQRYPPEHRAAHQARYTLDPQVVCLSRLANTWWFLGRPDEAVRARDAALALADEVGNPSSRGTALVFAALLAVDMHEPERVRAYTAALGEDLQHQMRASHAAAAALRGFVDVLDGETAAGLERIRRVLEGAGSADHAPGLGAAVTRLLLEACVIAGDHDAGVAAADRLLAMGGAARVWEPEARRVRARLLGADRSRHAGA
ncbi:MAG TPA: AAA family ATPase [Candidatus Binatia bacterium]|jgi:DNA-binding SARP family transcriptional activator|nr:AAA family ATPase [Candidatus Binatia bacterium]